MTKPKPKETQPDLLGMKDVTPKPTKEGLVAAAAAVEADGAAKKRKSPEPKTLPQYAAEKAAAKKEVAVHQPRAPKVPAANDNPNMLAVIARAAADPNVNVEKMQSLLNMQKEIVAGLTAGGVKGG